MFSIEWDFLDHFFKIQRCDESVILISYVMNANFGFESTLGKLIALLNNLI